MKNNPRLQILFNEMYAHTHDECGQCKNPYSCCQPLYCKMAYEYTKKAYGVDLTSKVVNPKIPFLSEKGCVIEPHYRPLCTIHNCDIASVSFHKDQEWTNKYFDIRNRIMEATEMTIDQHIAWLNDILNRGEISYGQYHKALTFAKMFEEVPIATRYGNEITYTYKSNIKVVFYKDGKAEIGNQNG